MVLHISRSQLKPHDGEGGVRLPSHALVEPVRRHLYRLDDREQTYKFDQKISQDLEGK